MIINRLVEPNDIGTPREDINIDRMKYPWKVTAYRHWDGLMLVKTYRVVGYFKHHWQANAVSWFYHHFFNLSCNTWIYKGYENARTSTND